MQEGCLMSDQPPKRRDGLLTLYYEGGSAALFDPIDSVEPPQDLDVKLCEAVLAAIPDNPEALSYLGAVYTKRGEYQKGLELDLRLLRIKPASPRVHYNLACSYTLLGRIDDAFKALNRAIEFGFADAEHMEKDEDLNGLHDDERFQAMVKRIKTSSEDE
jgi:tetratricopeptide (TPR) repeat protein